MSEPVGNAPRQDAVPSNTIKDREKRTVASTTVSNSTPTPVEEREPAEKIIQGEVTTRKVPWYRRAGRSIFAEDFKSIGDFALQDLVIPTIRNTIRELVVGVVDRALWGTKMGPAQRGPIIGIGGSMQSSISTRYDRMSEGSRVMSREARARHDFNEIVFPVREEALIILNGLISRIERFRVVTVADLYNLCGVSSGDFAAQNWGWTDLSTASVRQRHNGWLLDLPEPDPIRN